MAATEDPASPAGADEDGAAEVGVTVVEASEDGGGLLDDGGHPGVVVVLGGEDGGVVVVVEVVGVVDGPQVGDVGLVEPEGGVTIVVRVVVWEPGFGFAGLVPGAPGSPAGGCMAASSAGLGTGSDGSGWVPLA